MTNTSIPPAPSRDGSPGPEPIVRGLVSRLTHLEIIVGALIALVMVSLVLIEPNILEAPFQNARTLLFTFGGTALAALGLGAMLWFRVPPLVRVVVLVVPFVIVNWWLISPYFVDDSVDDAFSTSISQQLADSAETPATVVPTEEATESVTPTTDVPLTDAEAVPEEAPETEDQPAPAPSEPVLLGAGRFVGLAGHEGTGDAGIFQNPDGSLVVRFENFDIENGPDLEVYLVPGADQTSLAEGSIHLGALKGNVGDQNYDLPPGIELQPGSYTLLVWCEAFSVEFVGATIEV